MTGTAARWITLVAAALLFALATSRAQGAAQRDTLSHTIAKRDDWARVRVSRREFRAEFHTDTTRGWGWSEQSDPAYLPRYAWSISVDGMDGPRSLMVDLLRDKPGARKFPSLARVVAAARAAQCSPGMIAHCVDGHVLATVKGDAVVLLLRDSASIARLFGMRPEYVQAWETRPEKAESRSIEKVRVEYIDPYIPEPRAATRADAARSQRRYQASITTISRFIDGGEGWPALWVATDDSLGVRVSESHCVEDSCGIDNFTAIADSGWSVDDSQVVRLQSPAHDSGSQSAWRGFGLRWYVKGLRPGTTTIRVHGLRGKSDTAASSRPPERDVERQVIVTLPVARIAITPRPDAARLGQPLPLTVQAFDSTGRALEELPATLAVEGSPFTYGATTSLPIDVDLRSPGRKRLVARVGQHADTLVIIAEDSSRASPKR